MKKIIFLMIVIGICGCSSDAKREKHIRQGLSQEENVVDANTLRIDINKTINESKTLTDQQKVQLQAILEEAKVKMASLIQDSSRLKAVLVKEILSGKVDTEELRIIKKRIRSLDSKKTKFSFEAIDKIAKITMKDEDQRLYIEDMLYYNRAMYTR
jgi:hypothetical protein